jgi:drug/metabolite transporter (DMT)-like permease
VHDLTTTTLPANDASAAGERVSGEPGRHAVDADAAALERRALWLMVASAVAFGVMAFFAKLASGGVGSGGVGCARIGGAEVAAMRFAFGLLPLLLVPRVRRRALDWQRRDLLLYRGLFGGSAVLLYFVVIDHTSVGLATLLTYMAPIFSALFAARFIGEPVRAGVLPPLVMALAGAFLVVRAHGATGAAGAGVTPHLGLWSAVGLLSAALSGAAVTAIRAARRTESSWAVYMSFNAVGLVATLPFALTAWTWPDARGWLALAAVGAFSTLGQLLMTYAYRWVDNLRQGVLAQLAVFVAMALGAAFLGEPLTAGSVLGSLLTVAGVVAVVALAGRGARAVTGVDS